MLYLSIWSPPTEQLGLHRHVLSRVRSRPFKCIQMCVRVCVCVSDGWEINLRWDVFFFVFFYFVDRTETIDLALTLDEVCMRLWRLLPWSEFDQNVFFSSSSSSLSSVSISPSLYRFRILLLLLFEDLLIRERGNRSWISENEEKEQKKKNDWYSSSS